MSESEKISPEAAVLGEAIRELRAKNKLRVQDLAEILGLTEAAAKKIQRGVGLERIIRFGKLCRRLGATPNDLLGFNAIGDTERVRGAMEQSYLFLGLPQAEAEALADAVLTILQEPPLQSAELPPRVAGRIQVEIELRKAARPKRS